MSDYTIPNKQKRVEVKKKVKAEKRKSKKEKKEKRKREEELGELAPPKKIPRTLDSMREKDHTVVEEDDEEVIGDDAMDEFASYFEGEKEPKLLLTTCQQPSRYIYQYLEELLNCFHNIHYYKRGTYELKKIVDYANEEDFTCIIVVAEHKHRPCGLYVINLPEGPTAHYKLTNFQMSKNIQGHGKVQTEYKPELVLNNFNTRLGHSISRMMMSLYPQSPQFNGRRVITFHNQRDFIFFRQHRYIFESKEKARIQELGPRFTLKLQTLQKGTFDTQHGEYVWVHKREMDTSRRRFFL